MKNTYTVRSDPGR